MAKGWESKSVESQLEAQEDRATAQREKRAPAEDPEITRKRRGLQLSRSHMQQELAAAENPRRRQQIEAALQEIERQLTEVG